MPPRTPESDAVEAIANSADVKTLDWFLAALRHEMPIVWASEEVTEAAEARRKELGE